MVVEVWCIQTVTLDLNGMKSNTFILARTHPQIFPNPNPNEPKCQYKSQILIASNNISKVFWIELITMQATLMKLCSRSLGQLFGAKIPIQSRSELKLAT